MSSIGLLPVVVAFSAVAFLWAMVNYNGFLKIQSKIQKLKDLLNIHRNNLLVFLENDLRTISSHQEILSQIYSASQVWKEGFDNSQERKLLSLLSSFQKKIEDSNDKALTSQLYTLQNKLLQTQRLYNQEVLLYNQLTKKRPSKWLAKWFKFKEIKLT